MPRFWTRCRFKSAAGFAGEYARHGTQVRSTRPDYRNEGFTTYFARVEVVEPVGDRAARVELLKPAKGMYNMLHMCSVS